MMISPPIPQERGQALLTHPNGYETLAKLTLEVMDNLSRASYSMDRLKLELQAIQTATRITTGPSTLEARIEAEAPELLTINDVTSRLGISRVTLWKLRKDCNFPDSIQVSERKIAFRRSDINQWMTRGLAHGQS